MWAYPEWDCQLAVAQMLSILQKSANTCPRVSNFTAECLCLVIAHSNLNKNINLIFFLWHKTDFLHLFVCDASATCCWLKLA